MVVTTAILVTGFLVSPVSVSAAKPAQTLKARQRAFLAWWRPLLSVIQRSNRDFQPVKNDIANFSSNSTTAEVVGFYVDAKLAESQLAGITPYELRVPQKGRVLQSDISTYVNAEKSIAHDLQPILNNGGGTVAQAASLETNIAVMQAAEVKIVKDLDKASKGLKLTSSQLVP